MSNCRGILVAGLTNRARTQMAEGFLRGLSAGNVFVASGGVYHDGTVHPMAMRTMRRFGVDISGNSPSSLESARRQQDTYDVYISIDAPYHSRRADRFQRTALAKAAEERAHGHAGDSLYGDPLLAPPTPSHWGIGSDATDVRQRWTLWSPRDPSIFHETSTRKLQDHLYAGEPLFMRLEASAMRVGMKVTERWELEEVTAPFAMERPYEQQRRFDAAGEELCARAIRLLRRLGQHYGEDFLVNDSLLRMASERSARVRAELTEAAKERSSRGIPAGV